MSEPGKYKWGENEYVFSDESYDEELGEMRLFPDDITGSTASATESTGLIQIGLTTPDIQQAYDEVYSYRQTEPMKEEE